MEEQRPAVRSFSNEQMAQIQLVVQGAVQPMQQELGQMRYDLDENNAKTREMYEMFSTAKGGLKVVGYVGTLLKWAAGVGAGIAALMAIFHNGKPPGV